MTDRVEQLRHEIARRTAQMDRRRKGGRAWFVAYLHRLDAQAELRELLHPDRREGR